MRPLHGLGGARDLPIPAWLAITGASAALLASFAVLLLAWRKPRFDGAHQGRPLTPALARTLDSPLLRMGLRLLGLGFFALVTAAAVAGADDLTNPVFGVFYVLMWVGLVPVSLLFGPFWRLISPVRTLHLLFSRIGGGAPGLRAYPARWGYWPAAIGLFAFVWQELVNPDQTVLSGVRLWLALYLAAMLLGAAIFGEEWLARADPFEVFSTLVGHLAVLGRRADGVLVWRTPLANLDSITPAPGLVAVLAVLLGSTAYDSASGAAGYATARMDSGLSPVLFDTLGLTLACALVALTFSAAAMATPAASVPRRELPGQLVHSLVPIVVGYVFAHYLSYLLEQGQVLLRQLSDPLSVGADLFGTGDLEVSYWLSQRPTMLASLKVLAIVLGHILGAVAAHDRVLRLVPSRHRFSGQLAMIVVMVAYTATGLWLLFSA